jgi:16S rRNA (adenine1518-N6/adenine1519-N6)-dimethyltransferase
MPNKSLGQHWLKDRLILEAIVDCADVTKNDTVLEIGPGLGTLTSVLLSRAKNVIAVEYDEELAHKLPAQFPGKDLGVINEDILSYDFTTLPKSYKVIGNIPYYITNKIVRAITETLNPPEICVLLVQKEVAERLASGPGEMGLPTISTQVFFEVSLGPLVSAAYFTPPPKVDSQVVVMTKRPQPLVPTEQQEKFFRFVKAGFSERRKKLRSSLSGGLGISKAEAEAILTRAGVSLDARAQELSIEQWLKICNN